jgi:hypothetical protein
MKLIRNSLVLKTFAKRVLQWHARQPVLSEVFIEARG